MDTTLKVPVARLGTWYHPRYGIVQFTQDDFDQMMSNFEKNELGYPPYMRYGHDLGVPGTVDSEPSRGNINSLVQDGDILYSYVAPTDEAAVEDVQSKRMRFASAELTRNMTSKNSGENIGTVLTAIALTNAPFVPDLPYSEVLSANADDYFVLELSDGSTMKQECAMTCPECEGPMSEEGHCEICGDEMHQEYASKTESGVAHPASHYAYVPEPDKPSTWKLLIHDKAHVAAAAAALGKGFRGNKVSLPSEDRAAVVAKVRSAWKKFNPGKETEDMPDALKLSDTHSLIQKLYDEFSQFFSSWKTKPEICDKCNEEACVCSDAPQAIQEEIEETQVNETESVSEVVQLSQTAELEERLAALEAEKQELASQLNSAKTQAEEAAKAAELLSNALAEKKVEGLKADLLSKGIPPIVIEQAFSLAASLPTDTTVKLSNGNDGSIFDKMAEVLDSLPEENRVKLEQVGHTLSNSVVEPNPYKEIVERRLGKKSV